MKILAIYYPQFHSIPENDNAWGEGFTDWVNVKKSKPLFLNHYQPRIPLHKKYYDLRKDNNILNQQVDLAKKYGINGFCFYHYWFDGKLLLNDPLEAFLRDETIDFSFCLSWANETWSKRWIGDSTIIQEQKHTPDPVIWEKHFNYLINFFKDKRYLKIANKPVFIIYQPSMIKDFEKMQKIWNDLALLNGFDGIYYILTKRHNYLPLSLLCKFDGVLKFQPQEVYNNENFQGRSKLTNIVTNKLRFLPERVTTWIYHIRSKFENYKLFDSDKIWEFILSNAYKGPEGFDGKVYESAYVNWDNTPRYGKKATVFTHVEPQNFEKKFKKLYLKSIDNNSEFLFINAWNEWAEGAYLEPDEKYEYSYLEAIQNTIATSKDELISE